MMTLYAFKNFIVSFWYIKLKQTLTMRIKFLYYFSIMPKILN